MAVLTPTEDVPLAEAATFTRTVGGAELNVALTLARLGVPTAWLSRLGDDGFGEHVLAVARAHGVDTAGVEVDAQRPTGLYVKAPAVAADGSRRSRMHYYRSGSAAAALTPGFLRHGAVAERLRDAEVVHVSGITPGLSDGAAAFCAALAATVAAGPARLCVDLNHRPLLWAGRSDAPLRDLLDAADDVLLGADEARVVFGTDDPARLAALLPRARRILLKDEERGVVVVEGGTVTHHVAVQPVEVVEPVGAGDAFAAGYLAGTVRGLDVVPAVELGHRCAAAALVVREDRPVDLPAGL